MNREIRFRGKPVSKQFGEWVEGFYLEDLDNGQVKSYIFSCPSRIEVDPGTIGQYTGFIDEKGKEIYEGDILKITMPLKHSFPIIKKRTVLYEKGGFGVVWTDARGGFDSKWLDLKGMTVDYLSTLSYNIIFQIIGNIYDNTDLLK